VTRTVTMSSGVADTMRRVAWNRKAGTRAIAGDSRVGGVAVAACGTGPVCVAGAVSQAGEAVGTQAVVAAGGQDASGAGAVARVAEAVRRACRASHAVPIAQSVALDTHRRGHTETQRKRDIQAQAQTQRDRDNDTETQR